MLPVSPVEFSGVLVALLFPVCVCMCIYIYIFYGCRGVHGELLTSLCPCPTTSPPLFALFLVPAGIKPL